MSLFKLFKGFKNATVELSGVYYCTSVRVLEHCMYISLGFKTAMKNSVSNPEVMCVLYYIIDKWLKYFSFDCKGFGSEMEISRYLEDFRILLQQFEFY